MMLLTAVIVLALVSVASTSHLRGAHFIKTTIVSPELLSLGLSPISGILPRTKISSPSGSPSVPTLPPKHKPPPPATSETVVIGSHSSAPATGSKPGTLHITAGSLLESKPVNALPAESQPIPIAQSGAEAAPVISAKEPLPAGPSHIQHATSSLLEPIEPIETKAGIPVESSPAITVPIAEGTKPPSFIAEPVVPQPPINTAIQPEQPAILEKAELGPPQIAVGSPATGSESLETPNRPTNTGSGPQPKGAPPTGLESVLKILGSEPLESPDQPQAATGPKTTELGLAQPATGPQSMGSEPTEAATGQQIAGSEPPEAAPGPPPAGGLQNAASKHPNTDTAVPLKAQEPPEAVNGQPVTNTEPPETASGPIERKGARGQPISESGSPQAIPGPSNTGFSPQAATGPPLSDLRRLFGGEPAEPGEPGEPGEPAEPAEPGGGIFSLLSAAAITGDLPLNRLTAQNAVGGSPVGGSALMSSGNQNTLGGPPIGGTQNALGGSPIGGTEFIGARAHNALGGPPLGEPASAAASNSLLGPNVAVSSSIRSRVPKGKPPPAPTTVRPTTKRPSTRSYFWDLILYQPTTTTTWPSFDWLQPPSTQQPHYFHHQPLGDCDCKKNEDSCPPGKTYAGECQGQDGIVCCENA